MQEQIDSILRGLPPRDPNYVPVEEPEEKPEHPLMYLYRTIFERHYRLYGDCHPKDFGKDWKKCLGYLKEGYGLYIYGGVGVGKTRLALLCLKWWILERKQKGFIYTAPDMLDNLRSCIAKKDDNQLEEYLRYYIGQPMLVIDDFGVQAGTEWANEKMYEIIDARWQNRDQRITIVTSNFNPDEVVKRSRDEVVADRIVSRLVGMCKRIELLGSDRRIK